jgi:glucose-6-phosphate dehydrogenase assembly protein OpcA
VIYDLPDTTTGAVNKKIIEIRETGGAVALGRVMTLIIVTDDGPAEEAIRAANDASREHPCRVIAVVRGNRRGTNRLDAQIRVGGDAGASEVIVLRVYGPLADHGDSVVVPFLLPDAPIVAWWPGACPEVPIEDPIGRMAQRRITDSSHARNPIKELQHRAERHAPGDTDLAWSRVTLWRGLLAAALDEPPYESVTRASVSGGSDSPSTDVLAAWLSLYLKCPVKRMRTAAGSGLVGIKMERPSGAIELVRPDGKIATLTQPGQPERRIALAQRADRDCLAEELRRLDPDDVFADVVTKGLKQLTASVPAPSGRAAAGARKAPPARKQTASTSAPALAAPAAAVEAAPALAAPAAAVEAAPGPRAHAKEAEARKGATKQGTTKNAAKRTATKKAGTRKAATKKAGTRKAAGS